MPPLPPETNEEKDYDDGLDDRGDSPGSQTVYFDRHTGVEVWWHCCSKSLGLVVVDLVVLLGVRLVTDIGGTFE